MSFSIAVIVPFVWIQEAQYPNHLYSPLVAFWRVVEKNGDNFEGNDTVYSNNKKDETIYITKQ